MWRCLLVLFLTIVMIAPVKAQVAGPIPATFFGLSTLHYGVDTPTIPSGLIRSWDGGGLNSQGIDWADSNSFPSVYNFNDLDQFIAFGQAHSSDMIYTFGRTPRWASSHPNNILSPYGTGECAPPSNLANWDNYVRAIVIHAAGRIKYWELWNEAQDPQFYCGSIPTLVLMAQHAYAIIKSIDPTAMVLSPSVVGSGSLPWLTRYITAGGGRYADIIAFHAYTGQTAESVVSVIQAYKSFMQAHGLSAKPLWDTESSWATGNTPTLTAAQEAGFVAKYYLLHWSGGVSSFTWYAYDSGLVWGQLWNSTDGLSTAGTAYAQTYNWMVGATMSTACSKDGNNIWACTLTRANGYQAQATWISNSSMSVTVPSIYTQYRDLAGTVHPITNNTVTIGDQPILLETGSIPLSAFYCSGASVLGSASETCVVKLTAAAGSGGMSVSLSSNNTAVTIPATVTVPANATNAQFMINVASVPTTQTVILTASAGGVSIPYTIQLNAAIQTLGIGTQLYGGILNRGPMVFQDILVNNTATQSFTLIATGTEPVIITSAVLTGANFTLSGATFPLTLKAGQGVTLTVQFYPTAAGPSTGQIAITSNATNSTAAVISLTGTALVGPGAAGTPAKTFVYTGSALLNTLVPPGSSTVLTKDFFTMTIIDLAPNTFRYVSNQTPFPSFSVSALRLWDVTGWSIIDAVQGENNWTEMDNVISIAQQSGVNDFIYTFGRVPAWASTNPTDPCTGGEGVASCSPPNMTYFDSFVTNVVQRYCGKIEYYEPWNEPENPIFWDGTNAQLLAIAHDVYQIVKNPANCGCTNGVCAPNGGVNPNKVLLPPIGNTAPTGGIAWLSSYLAAAGTTYPYADIAAYHGYQWHGYQPEEILTTVPPLQQLLTQYGLGNLPLWNTEVSFENDSYLTQPEQVSWLMQYHMYQAIMGISRVGWYAYDRCTWGTLWSSPLCGNTAEGPVNQLTQAGTAYTTIENWFIGTRLTQCQEYQNGLWACELQRAGGYDAWMLWNSSTTTPTITVPVPANLDLVQYRDWQNNVNPLQTQIAITSMPVLLENNP